MAERPDTFPNTTEGNKQFFEWCEKMREENPLPFPSDTRDWKIRKAEMEQLFNDKTSVEAYEMKRGGYSWEYTKTEGVIERVCDGIWGYGGDAVAVVINGEYYPSSQVRAKQ